MQQFEIKSPQRNNVFVRMALFYSRDLTQKVGQNLFAIFIFRKAAPFQDFKRNVTSCGFVVNPLGGLTVS